MAWETTSTFVDEETGIQVSKQHRKRKGHSGETRYLVNVRPGLRIYVRRAALFDLADALGEYCDQIDEGKIA